MTQAREEQDRARQTVAAAERILSSLTESLAEMDALAPLDEARLETLPVGERRTVDAFLKRFQDAVEAGRRLFRVVLVLLDEDQSGLSAIDVMNMAEKYGVLPSALVWRDVVKARKEIAHGYAMTLAAAARAINAALPVARQAADQLRAAITALRTPRFGLAGAGEDQ